MPIPRRDHVYHRPAGDLDLPVDVKQELRDYLARFPEILKAYLICVSAATGERKYIFLGVESAGASLIDPVPNVSFRKIIEDNKPWIGGVLFVNNLDVFFGIPNGRDRFVEEAALIYEKAKTD